MLDDNSSHPKKILIIGGVAGGASSATRVRRLSETAEIIIFERGEHISFANCGLPYHIGGDIADRNQLLLQTPSKMRERYNIDVRIKSEVLRIDRTNKTLYIRDNNSGNEYSETYDVLILSPGAKPTVPPIPGIESKGIFTLRNIQDMDNINNWIREKSPKNAVVVGGGYIGLEMAEAISNRKISVSIIELAKQVMGPLDPEMASLLSQELEREGVELKLGVAAKEFKSLGNKIEITLNSGEIITTDIVILAIGVKPESELAKNAGLKIGELGGILVSKNLLTSDPYIYAIGDAIEVTDFVTNAQTLIPLAGPANRQGRIVADNIFGRVSFYSATQGTGICKVFNLTAGMTGINEKTLINKQKPYEKIYLHTSCHASYYPNASQISLKLLFDPNDGTILGAQAIGAEGVDKRIDVLATAIRAKLNVFSLTELELSYAPPYGSAKDIVNYAGFIATNVINGDVKICQAIDLLKTPQEGTTDKILLDVRTKTEVMCGTIPSAINIPIDELRGRLQELPKNKEIIAFCKVGLRGYLACRILAQNGFNCANLSGGYTTYLMAKEAFQGAESKETTQPKITTSEELKCAKITNDISILKHIDARGLQCPGPIQKLKSEIDNVNQGEIISITSTDPGFLADAPAWCRATGNTLISTSKNEDGYIAVVSKGGTSRPANIDAQPKKKKMTIVVFSGDLDHSIAAFIIANGAAALGYEPILFFTFWGINVLRKHNNVNVRKSFIENMFSMMMPRGARRLALSKMNMLGIGPKMIKDIMRKKGASSLNDLIQDAQKNGVKLIACSMSMDIIGIKKEELIDWVEIGGVAAYLEQASEGSINLFI